MVKRGQGLHTVIHKIPSWLTAPSHTNVFYQVGNMCVISVFPMILKLRKKSKMQEHHQAHTA